MNTTEALKRLRDDIKTWVTNNLKVVGGAGLKYNPNTDNIDIYDDGVLKGSIATGLSEPVGLVPVLGANTDKILYTSEFSSNYAAYKAFNKTTTDGYDCWSPTQATTIGAYLGYIFNSKKTVTKVFLKNRSAGAYVEYVTSFKLQGSNDLTEWYDIQTFTPSITAVSAEEYFIVDNPQSFLAFRIVILGAQRPTVCIGELQFYGYNEIGVALPKATKSVTLDDSDVFSTEKTYAVGDYCIYNDILYKFIAEKTAGEWDDTVVEATTVVKEIGVIGANFPDYSKAIEVTGTTYTADENGFLVGSVYVVGATNASITINGKQMGWVYAIDTGGTTNIAVPFCYPLAKGDVIAFSSINQTRHVHFVPMRL